MRNIRFTNECWIDYLYWQGQDLKTFRRINDLIKAAQRDPFDGIGKPEPLKADMSGFWSRRIDHTNRLVYAATGDELTLVSCRYHY